MLVGNNMEKELDKVLADVIPFLIFPPSTFRNALAELVKHIFAESTSHDREHFIELKEAIMEKIKTREQFQSNIEDNIFSFNNQWKTFNERLTEIETNYFKLKNEIRKMIKETTAKEIPPCPNCKTNEFAVVHLRRFPSTYYYRCTKRFGGCGKQYTPKSMKVGE